MSVSEKLSIRVQYFALLKDEAGLGEETCLTQAVTVSDLYAELAKSHGFSLPSQFLKVAVNNEFRPWQTKLKANDTVVFIPPVAGG